MSKKPASENARRILNKKARHQYHIQETVEAGMVLTGSEVKSLREGHAQLNDAFVRIHGEQVELYNCQIDRYPHAGPLNHEPLRKRRLLLHKAEIRKIAPQLDRPGTTLIPLSIYFNSRGLAKIELAVATGKKEHDNDPYKKRPQRTSHPVSPRCEDAESTRTAGGQERVLTSAP